MIDAGRKDVSKYADVDRVLNDTLMAIHCRYGKFYPNKDYGSLIKNNELNSVLAGARYAVRNIDGVVIKSGSIVDDKILLDIIINDEERSVTI